ncbi:uncharacterized protein LOC131942179 [Physella acuta]|uniref:uncharacterized protein LOC131942179 n=1 Tax=Physella acuta TaxID=109671 RepID=UPI0027DD0D50|nr:uncharacterized protein LOC131942179 [Physella acuta]
MLTGINTNCDGNSEKPEKLEIIYTCYPIIPNGQSTFDMAANFKITKPLKLNDMFYLTLNPLKKTIATVCLVESDYLNVQVDVLSNNDSPKISCCQEQTQTKYNAEHISSIQCYHSKTMRFSLSTDSFTFIKITVRKSGNISLSCARGEKDITTTEATITDVEAESNPTTIIITSTSKPTFATTKTNVWSTWTTEKGLTSDTTKSRSSDSVKGDDEEEKSSKIALICAVSAGAVFVIIIIVISAVCVRKRCTNRQSTLPAIIPPKAHYKSEDEYAIIDATSSYENANSNELSGPTTTVPLRDNTNADEDSDAFDDYSTIPKTDEQYTEISSIPGAFAGTAESEGKTKSMRKGSNSVSCSQQPSLQPTADAPSAVYSTPNKLKKNIQAPNPASDPPPAADSASGPAPESNDVYSHLSHYIQNKPETDNVYNG